MGNRVETEIAEALQNTPQLVKLGITMEFRDTLNRAAVQLQKNLDKSKLDDEIHTRHSLILSVSGRKGEDKSLTLKLDEKFGPSIVEE